MFPGHKRKTNFHSLPGLFQTLAAQQVGISLRLSAELFAILPRTAPRYRAGMKSSDRQKGSVTKPLLKELVDLEKANSNVVKQVPSVESVPLDPPDLYQDAGGGYNPDFTFPQE